MGRLATTCKLPLQGVNEMNFLGLVSGTLNKEEAEMISCESPTVQG